MSRKKKIYDGVEFTSKNGDTYKIVKEIEKGVGNVRRFELECLKCNSIKHAQYANIFTSKSVTCSVCIENGRKTIPTKETLLSNKSGKARTQVRRNFVGETVKCTIDKFLVIEELPTKLSKNKRNTYRNFKVQCINCKTQREALAASILSGTIGCKQCRKEVRKVNFIDTTPITEERKIEVMLEMNDIWEQMMNLHRRGLLLAYLLNTYNDANIEYEEKIIEPVDEDDDNDDDIDDWNDRINNLDI